MQIQYTEWVEKLRSQYLSGQSVLFVMHGNVNDLYPWTETMGVTRFVDLSEYLGLVLQNKKDVIIEFNMSDGFNITWNPAKKLNPLIRKKLERLESNKFSVSQSLAEMERIVLDPECNAGIILHYAEMVFPMNTLNYMSEAAMTNLIQVLEWTKNEYLSSADNIIILTTENLTEMHKRLTSSTHIGIIEIPLPTSAERLLFVTEYVANNKDVSFFAKDVGLSNFAEMCAGLTLLQIQGLLRQVKQSKQEIHFATVNQHKKNIIERECHGLVEFVAPKHNFSHVGGFNELKSELMGIATAIKNNQYNQVPMGMLFVGPMGTGKTFIAEAFAGESGLTCIKLKNFREKWVGSTESNFEKILHVVNALGYVLLIIDEADRSMSSSDNDSEVNSRVIARLKEFMSDTNHRGRIVVVMMTNRPDKIDIDLKRPGRLDYKVPFFFPQDSETRLAILQAQTRKNKITLAKNCGLEGVASALEGYSAAEIESVLLRALNIMVRREATEITEEMLQDAVQDVIPSRDKNMLGYMEMQAVFEASSRGMLPEKYKKMTAEEVQEELDRLKMVLGRRL